MSKITKILLILSILPLVFFMTGVSVVYADTAGYTTIGASTAGNGTTNDCNDNGLLITIPSAGTMTKITAYVSNNLSTTNGNATLYAGSAGSRGAFIANTQAGSVTTSFAWVDFTFAVPQAVSATTYWIEFSGQCGGGPGTNVSSIRYDTGGGSNTSYQENDVLVPVYSTRQYSMYATYTPDAEGQTSHANVVVNGNLLIGNNANVVIQ